MDTSKQSGYKDFIWAIELNRFGLKLLGLWPQFNEAAQNSLASDLRLVTIFIILAFLSFIPLLWAFVRIWGDMILMINNLQTTLPVIVSSLKLVIMRCKQTAVSFLIKMIEEDWMREKKETEKNMMIKRARTARLIVSFGYSLMIFASVVIIVLPCFGLHFRHITNITDQDRLLPLPAYYFYNTDKSPYFELTLIVQALTIVFGATAYTAVDALLGVAIFHMSGQLENFRYQVINLASCRDFYSALRAIVRTHLRLIRFSNCIEDIFSLMLLVLVLYFGIAFCVYGFFFVIIITSGHISNISFSRICFVLIGVVTVLTYTFLYCAAGEIVVKRCEAIYRAMCDLEWYKLESKKRRTLILLLLRCNEPFRITAGSIFPLTMTTFCSLLKTSAGYISFLLAKN